MKIAVHAADKQSQCIYFIFITVFVEIVEKIY